MILVSHIKRTVQVLVYVALCAAFAVALGLCGACLALGKPRPDPVPVYGLTQAEQRAASMIVYVECSDSSIWHGSAVVVDPYYAITAAHVVDCPPPAVTQRVLVGYTRDAMQPATVDRMSVDSDLARLRVEFPFEGVRPAAEMGSVFAGDAICIAAAHPERLWSCGAVQTHTNWIRNDIGHTAPTRAGNSGSGVYDVHGRLVGIVTTCYAATLETGEIVCTRGGGRATALDGRGWVLP